MAKTIGKGDKREAILSAMLDLVVERGFDNAPMAALAERSGASPGVIYHYFSSKDDLIRMVRLASLRDPAIKMILPELGKRKSASNEKERRVLGWTPRSNEEALTATAESLVRLHLLKDSPKRAA